MVLPKLTEEQQEAKDQLIYAYSDFWEHEKLQTGIAAATVPLEGALPLLNVAADIVVRTRSELDANASDSEQKERLAAGLTGEYLWGVCGDPEKAPKAFIRAVVHATLSDPSGYVEGLTEEKVDDYIHQFGGDEYSDDAACKVSIDEMKTSLASRIAEITNKIQSIAPKDEKFDKDPKLPFRAQRSYDKVVKLLAMAENELENLATIALETIEDAEISKAWDEAFPLPSVLEKRKSIRSVKLPPAPKPDDSVEKAAEETTPEPMDTAEAKTEEPTEPTAEVDAAQVESPDSGAIEVQKVASEVEGIVKDMSSFMTDANALESINTKENPKYALNVVEGLEKRCLTFSNSLMNELLALDSISIPREKEESRKKRKEQVVNIQELMNNLDKIMEKLREQHKELAEEASKAAAAEEEKMKEEKQSLKPAVPAPVVPENAVAEVDEEAIVDEILKRMWERLRLRPKFEISERQNALVLSALIPGMRTSDIEISVSENYQGPFLLVKGRRVPSEGEMGLLKDQLEAQKQRMGISSDVKLGIEDRVQLLLRIGSGTFGTMEEKLQIPMEFDVESTHVNYQRGILRIVIPRAEEEQMPSPFLRSDLRRASNNNSSYYPGGYSQGYGPTGGMEADRASPYMMQPDRHLFW